MKNIDRNAINITIGKHMADLRDKFHLSQKEISGVVGVNRNTYKCYEIGDRTPPFQLIRDLANFYKVSTDYFFEDMPQLTLKEQMHITETALEGYDDFDYVLPNDIKDDLKDKVFKFLEGLE